MPQIFMKWCICTQSKMLFTHFRNCEEIILNYHICFYQLLTILITFDFYQLRFNKYMHLSVA